MELTNSGRQNGPNLNKSWDSLDLLHHHLVLPHVKGLTSLSSYPQLSHFEGFKELDDLHQCSCIRLIIKKVTFNSWSSQSQTWRVLKIWTNIHQKQQLHCVTNQALKLYSYLNMHVYVYKSCKLHPSCQKERADCGRELSWINVALTFTCQVFDADTFFAESEKPLLLQRNFLYLSDAACII